MIRIPSPGRLATIALICGAVLLTGRSSPLKKKRLRQLSELLETFMFDGNNTSSRRRRSIPQNAFIESNLPWPDFEW